MNTCKLVSTTTAGKPIMLSDVVFFQTLFILMVVLSSGKIYL